MENIDNPNNILNNQINQKKYKKPLEDIINNNFSMFKMEDIIHIFFSIKEQDNNLIHNIETNCSEELCYINKNTLLQLKIFIEVLRENYDDDSIIKELYKYLFYEKAKNQVLQSKKLYKKKNRSKNEITACKGNDLNAKNKEIYYPLVQQKRKKLKSIGQNFIKIKNYWLIPIKSNYSNNLIKEEYIPKDIIGYLYKNEFNQIYIYYPILEENNLLSDSMNNIIKDKNKILFLCELYSIENENDRCNSYGVFDLATNYFSHGAIHSKIFNAHQHSQIFNYNNSLMEKDELTDIISKFYEMKIKEALIIKENV